MTHDDFRQFGSVKYIQQRTYYRTLGHSTQDCLHDGQLTVVGDLFCAVCQKRRNPVEYDASNVDADLWTAQQDRVVDTSNATDISSMHSNHVLSISGPEVLFQHLRRDEIRG